MCRLRIQVDWRESMHSVIYACIAVFLFSAAAGCSKDLLKRSSYEALHNISDQHNADNERYESDDRIPYDVYQDKRRETLEKDIGEDNKP